MDIHTVCYMMKSFKDFNDPINVNKIVALVRASRGERFEIAIYRPPQEDQRAQDALDYLTDAIGVDPVRGKSRFDPRQKHIRSLMIAHGVVVSTSVYVLSKGIRLPEFPVSVCSFRCTLVLRRI